MSTILFGISALVLAFVIWKVYAFIDYYRKLCAVCKKIPSRKPHWLLGNLDTISNSTQYMELVEELTKNGAKLYCIWAGPWPIIGTTHPDTCKSILKTTEPKARRISDGYRMLTPWLGEGLLLTSGPRWERSRRLLTPAFHFDILKDYIVIYNDVVDIFLENLETSSNSNDSVEIYDFVSKATLDTMLRCALSYIGDVQKCGEVVHPYVQAVRTLSRFLWKRLLSFWLYPDFIYYLTADGRESAKLVKYIHDFSENVIKARRKELEAGTATPKKRHPDFLDILLTATDDRGQHLTDNEIREEVDTFTFAGHDTTASAISFMVYSMSLHQDHQDVLYEEIQEITGNREKIIWEDLTKFDKLTAFMKESIRMFSPVPLVAREHKSTIVLDGIEIPVGPRIDINFQALHHNSEIWENPEVFNPSRFEDEEHVKDPYAFVPFSAGPRNCIGKHFAINEIKCFLARILKRYRVKPDKNHKTIVTPEVVTKPENGIRIYLEKR